MNHTPVKLSLWLFLCNFLFVQFCFGQLTDTTQVIIKDLNSYYQIENGYLGVRIPRSGLFNANNPDYVPAPLRCIIYRDGTLSNSHPNYLESTTPALSMTHEVLYQNADSCAIRISYTFDKPVFYAANGQTQLEPASPGYYRVTFRMVKGEKACIVTEESDFEVGYSVKASDGVSPDKGRYEGHSSSSIADGYDINGQVYAKNSLTGWHATVDLQYNQRKEYNLLARWDPFVRNSGWHWQLYNSTAPPDANTVGIFDGRPSLLRGATASGAGFYTEPNAITDLCGDCDENGDCHYAWLTENELWYKKISSQGIASAAELITTDVINPFVFTQGSTVNVLAIAPLEAAGSKARLFKKTANDAFQSYTLSFDATLEDPYLYGASNGTNDFILLKGFHNGQSGLQLYYAPANGTTFSYADVITNATAYRSTNRPDLKKTPGGDILLAYTEGTAYQSFNTIKAGTTVFSSMQQFPLGLQVTCGMGADARSNDFFWIHSNGTINYTDVEGTAVNATYSNNLGIQSFHNSEHLPNRRYFSTDLNGNALAVHEDKFYWFNNSNKQWSALTGGNWQNISSAHVHFNPVAQFFFIVGKYQGKLAFFSYFNTGNLALMNAFDDTERQSAGIRIIHKRLSPAGRYAPDIRFSWCIFADKKQFLPPASQVQPIALTLNRLSGFANKLTGFENDPAVFDNSFENGAIYMPSAQMAAIINKVKTDDNFHNQMKDIDPFFRPVMDAWRDAALTKTQVLYDTLVNRAEAIKTALTSGDGIYSWIVSYTNGGNAMRFNTLLSSGLMADGKLTAAQKGQLKKYTAMYSRILLNPDFVPNFDTSGMNAGFLGMATAHENYKYFHALLLSQDPEFSDLATAIPGLFSMGLSAHINEYGAGRETPHYLQSGLEGFVYTALQLKNAGIANKFQGSSELRLFSDFYLHLLTPGSVRFNPAHRKLICFGDGNEESAALFGLLSTGFAGTDDPLSKRLMHAYRYGPPRGSDFGFVTMCINHNLPDDANLHIGTGNFPGYLTTVRSAFGTPDETALWFLNGDFFRDHRNDDRGAFGIYALGAPLSLNYGSFYSPFMPGAHMKSIIVPLSKFPEWNQAVQPFAFPNELVWDSTGYQSCIALKNSACTEATQLKSDTWTRKVFQFHPRQQTPVFVIKDELGNTGEDYIWNMNFTARDTVVTPAGKVKPPPRLWNHQGGPNEQPAASPVIPLAAGLNRFDFKGINWIAHPANGIDWEVYLEQPTPQEATLSEWAHTFIPSVELNEFKTTNNAPSFEERQTVLRVKGKESFYTVIVPYNKAGRPANLNVSKSGNLLTVACDSFTFKTDLSYYTFEDASKKVLTIFDTQVLSFEGATIEDGPIELEIKPDSVFARLHGPSGQRKVTLPPGSWNLAAGPSSDATYNASSGKWLLNFTFQSSLHNSFSGGPTEFLFVKNVRVSPKVMLEGPYEAATGLMRDDLRSQQIIPATEPFTSLGFNHPGGGETVSDTVFNKTGENAIVDWVLVELRDKNDPTVLLATRAALLQRDGDVVDTDGLSPVAFFNAAKGSYYIAIRHRNHLGVMSASPVSLAIPIDFTTPATPAWGSNAQKTLSGNILGLWTGDLDASGTIDAADRNIAWNEKDKTGYQSSDASMNGVTNADDKAVTWQNRNHIAQLP